MIVDDIRKIAEEEGIPVWGIGPAAKMAGEPTGHQPGDLLPGAKSLVCFGIPVPKGVYRMPTYAPETIWRTQNLLYRRLDTLSLRIGAMLEESGAQVVPTFGCMPLGVNEKGAVAGYLNQIRMGEVTGIGVIGRNGLLLHSRYGARLMLGGILTSAVLPETRHPDSQEPGCPPGCRICVEACPVDAILPDKKQVRIMRCLSHTARTPAMSRLKFIALRAFDRQAAARYMSLTSFDEHTFHVCSRCVALCPYGQQK
jgi:epoxyqueuosine reductase